jgi:predicted phage terminase large subunit-like protein
VTPTEGTHAWRPNPGPQTQFLASSAYEVLFGGAAGGAKTESLIVAPLRWVDERDFRALLLRRTFPELEKSIVDRARQLYPAAVPGARYHDQKKYWQFPSGARIYFGHAEHEHDVHQYQGAEFQFVGFDELTHFTERQYTYLLSRARSSKGLPIRIRAATNPGGEGHEWVFRRWAPWLDPQAQDRAAPGETRAYVNTADGERYVPAGTPGALTRTFIPSRIVDNPHLMRHDPAYEQRLMGLDPVTRAQLLAGDWLARPARGAYFKRAWVTLFLEALPVGVAARVRYWDLAAGGDWAVGVRMARLLDRRFVVEHVARVRGTPHEVRATVKATAREDGVAVPVYLEQDPGQAGKDQIASYATELAAFAVRGRPKRVDKVTAFGPLSGQCEAGLVGVVRGLWNTPYFDELEAFPDGAHDDQVDASSGAYAVLVGLGDEVDEDALVLPASR